MENRVFTILFPSNQDRSYRRCFSLGEGNCSIECMNLECFNNFAHRISNLGFFITKGSSTGYYLCKRKISYVLQEIIGISRHYDEMYNLFIAEISRNIFPYIEKNFWMFWKERDCQKYNFYQIVQDIILRN